MKNLILLFSTLFSISISYGAHIPGGNISYECIGPNQFLVTLTTYEDICTGFIFPGGTLNITVTNDCGLPNPTLQVTNDGLPAPDISQVCGSVVPCQGGIPGNQVWTYTGVVTLPAECDGWHFAYGICCRDASTNLVGTGSNFYVSASLYSQTAPCNNSPTFQQQAIPYICVGQTYCIGLGITEVDGHTLTYTLVPPAISAVGQVPYQAGYSGANPYPGMALDPVTGQITGIAGITGKFSIAVLVSEYDANGNLVGTVVQDFSIEVLACTNQIVDCATSGVIDNIVGAVTQTGPTTLEMCEGVPFSFNMSFSDPDIGDSLFINSNIATTLPGSVVTYSYPNTPNANVITMTVSWVPPVGSANSNNIFVVNVNDNACPVTGSQTLVYTMNVLGSTNAGPDQTICLGDDAQLNVANGNIFNWTVLSGSPIQVGTNFSCNPCENPIASPNVTTTYEVISDLTGSCVNRDTVTVNVVPDFTFSLTQSSTTSCLNSDIQLEATPNLPGNYAYSWTPATFLNSTTVSNPTVTPTTPGPIQYNVQITSQAGCIRYGTLDINVAAAYSPDVTVTTNQTDIVCGDTIFFQSDLGGGVPATCGPSPNTTCSATATTQTIGTGTTSISNAPSPFYGFYMDGKVQMIYLANELQTAGFVGGKITELAFNITAKNSTAPYNNFNIKIGCTSATSLSTAVGYIGGLTSVYTNNSYNSTLGWNNFVLNTAYEWDGISNLIVEVCFDNSAWTQTDQVAQTSTVPNLTLFEYQDLGTASGCDMTGTGWSFAASANRPNIRFRTCPTIPDPANYSFQWFTTPGNANMSSTSTQNPFAIPQVTTDFQLVVTDLNGGCTDTVNVLINVMCDSCQQAIPVLTNATCFGGNDGQIVATPIGQHGPPFDVLLVNPGNQTVLQQENGVTTNATFSGLTAGQYIIRAIDTTGCWNDTLVTINQPPIMTLNVSNDTIVCIGGTAVMSATATGGNSTNYTYNWTGLAGVTSVQNVSPTAVTNYSVYALDPQGCSSDTLSVMVNMYPPILTSAGLNDTVCPGFSGVVSVNANGGFGGTYYYNWSDQNGNAVGGTNSTSVTPTSSPATYYVMVTDACETPAKLDSVKVFWYPVPSPSLTVDKVDGCYPIEVNFTNTTDPTFVAQCAWQFGDGSTSNTCGPQFHTYNGVGIYNVTLTVTSPDGCIGDTTYVGFIETYDYPVADFGIFPNPITVLQPTTSMHDSSSNDVTSYQWYFGEDGILGNSFEQNPTFTFPDIEPANYPVQLIVTNQNGCSDTTYGKVIMNGVYNFYVPSGFTPNNDGINDTFFPKGEGVDALSYDMFIFDRWGQIVFQSTESFKEWDGTKNGEPLPTGVYIWKIITKDVYTDAKFENRGHITLVR